MAKFDLIGKILAIQEKHYDFFYKNCLTIMDFIEFDFGDNSKVIIKPIDMPIELRNDIENLNKFQ